MCWLASLLHVTCRTEPFDSSIYSGYEPQRTHPASFRGDPPSTTGAHYYIFAKDSALTPEDPRSSSAAADASEANDGDAKPQRKQAWKKPTAADKSAAAASLECKVCATAFKDLKKYNAHINSAKHARKVKAQKKR